MPCLNTSHLLLEVLLFCAIVIVITLKNVKSHIFLYDLSFLDIYFANTAFNIQLG